MLGPFVVGMLEGKRDPRLEARIMLTASMSGILCFRTELPTCLQNPDSRSDVPCFSTVLNPKLWQSTPNSMSPGFFCVACLIYFSFSTAQNRVVDSSLEAEQPFMKSCFSNKTISEDKVSLIPSCC